MAILEVKRVSKSYRQLDGESTLAIDEISFQVERGQFVSLVGPSGCGKTTLLMSIAGLNPPSKGEVVVKNQKIDGPPPDLVLVFQEFNKSLFAWRSVLGNVLFGLEVKGEYSDAKERAGQLIELVGLEGFERHYPWEHLRPWPMEDFDETHPARGIALHRDRAADQSGDRSYIGYHLRDGSGRKRLRVFHSGRGEILEDGNMYAGIVLVAILGYALNRLFLFVETRVMAWHRGATAKGLA